MTASAPISTTDVAKASAQLRRMRASLSSWLSYRMRNDAVATGQAPSKLPRGLAKKVMIDDRDWATEQQLAQQLHVLLSEVMPDAQLPTPSIQTNRNAAVELAQIAIRGAAPAAGPSAQGFPFMWPVLIVGGLLLAVTTAISSVADVAKEKERLKCVQAGACTDYGFWLKAFAVVGLGWIAWKELGPQVRAMLPRGR